jgi:GxxExxY protein
MLELLEKDLVYRIVGCAMKVHSGVGYGLREKTYERALCRELAHEGISFSRQKVYPVVYRHEVIDEYIPDLEVEQKVLVETKTIDAIADIERGQMLNYLRISGLKVGLIVNFKRPSLQWERVVLDSGR